MKTRNLLFLFLIINLSFGFSLKHFIHKHFKIVHTNNSEIQKMKELFDFYNEYKYILNLNEDECFRYKNDFSKIDHCLNIISNPIFIRKRIELLNLRENLINFCKNNYSGKFKKECN